jgi:hypothetical protein
MSALLIDGSLWRLLHQHDAKHAANMLLYEVHAQQQLP